MHALRWPFQENFDLPELSGLAPGKTLNLNLTTSDGVRLGAWFVAADGFYQQHLRPSPPTETASRGSVLDAEKDRSTYHPRTKLTSILPLALQTHPTILYFHGNAYTRALVFRSRFYSSLSSRLDSNVFVIDYRGFGDSEGVPSEEGLLVDARAAWDWLIENGAKEGDVTVVGQSLGTGVSAGLVAALQGEGISPRAMVLMAPFSSIAKLLETYNLFGRIPILRPMRSFRSVFNIMITFLRHRFNTLSIVNLTVVHQSISCPITIIHAVDDWDIPILHARTLFDSLLESSHPAHSFDPDEALPGRVPNADMIRTAEMRGAHRKALVAAREVDGLGTIRRFERGASKGSVVMLETTWGEHNGIRDIEGVVDSIGWTVGKIE
ncbi:hypothetical protein FRC09_019578 [Ceratobasidium sp. 395]|nr:hypothetical protein FRC09_019578 [Ceratobasidium sp. 395]